MPLVMLLFAAGPQFIAAPAGYGSADRKVKAKVPVARPIKRSGPKKETIERKEDVDERMVVAVSDLELLEGAQLPQDADYHAVARDVLSPVKKLRSVFKKDCVSLKCLRALAAQNQTPYLLFSTLGADGRITLLLNELPGRGMLRQRTTAPLEAKDQFEQELTAALVSILGLGTPEEGIFTPDPKMVAAPAPSEDAATVAAREKLIRNSTYGVYASGGVVGIGMVVGMLATINASQWRDTSFRAGDPEGAGSYREQIRGIAASRALMADVFMITGALAGGASYYLQRQAVAGPGGKLTLGWGQDTWKEPEAAPVDPEAMDDASSESTAADAAPPTEPTTEKAGTP